MNGLIDAVCPTCGGDSIIIVQTEVCSYDFLGYDEHGNAQFGDQNDLVDPRVSGVRFVCTECDEEIEPKPVRAKYAPEGFGAIENGLGWSAAVALDGEIYHVSADDELLSDDEIGGNALILDTPEEAKELARSYWRAAIKEKK